MTVPDDKGKGSPRERFRNILSAEDADRPDREPRKPAVVNLPEVGEPSKPSPTQTLAVKKPRSVPAGSGRSSGLLPAFWTVGASLSVLANLILLGMLLGGRGALSSGGSADGLAGIYASLVQLDNAHIRTSIPLQTSIALDATVPVKTTTRITLAEDLPIRAAHITINSSGLSIDSPADITLPAGTEMNVNLDLAMPIQAAVPVDTSVPVDIAISDTEVHAAIQSLQAALRPLICDNTPGATLPDGTPICT